MVSSLIYGAMSFHLAVVSVLMVTKLHVTNIFLINNLFCASNKHDFEDNFFIIASIVIDTSFLIISEIDIDIIILFFCFIERNKTFLFSLLVISLVIGLSSS